MKPTIQLLILESNPLHTPFGRKEIFIALCLSIHLEHEDMVLFCQRLRITKSLVLQLTLCLVIIKIG